MNLFSIWMTIPKGANSELMRKRKYDSDSHAFDFTRMFDLPILLGDASIMDDFLGELRFQVKEHFPTTVDELCVPADILLRLVILRVYLGRKASDDGQIFHLAYHLPESQQNININDPYCIAKHGHIFPHIPLAEQAHRAGHGPDIDTRESAITLSSSLFSLVQAVTDFEATVEMPLASAHMADNSEYQWITHNSDLSLTGGPAFTPRFIQKKIEGPQTLPKPRPKPRAVQKKQKIEPISEENLAGKAQKTIIIPTQSRSGRTLKQSTWGIKLAANGKCSPKNKPKPGWHMSEYTP
ncbi:hypothetical protein BDQ12DRAFT_726428 [Crucibulum laeve]|uniref:Uncharacterized protein n=1 Tax=Crucibulum laeve TaxID=68775 RepID=A0A5C3LQT6_9AGAR|nr:hypothetical protein BDQ12DRAFT_726428 [Crucibulum laeve]